MVFADAASIGGGLLKTSRHEPCLASGSFKGRSDREIEQMIEKITHDSFV
jgi:hypothetical protein